MGVQFDLQDHLLAPADLHFQKAAPNSRGACRANFLPYQPKGGGAVVQCEIYQAGQNTLNGLPQAQDTTVKHLLHIRRKSSNCLAFHADILRGSSRVPAPRGRGMIA